ncbi:hypothetical protein XELAEV_18032493mg [Xenopus laevis]|uniref:RanBP-type and C3HC4-type zinc finger-containing protein 1 n=1 Tax=Xenopus laevis TaxID=8355 RepID=A0A974CPH7_XENLA|nr:hypothetical protein XELAEV_18032493mg [Xenopus laevis]
MAASKVPVPLPTVLMSVRAWLGVPGREAVQLQLVLGPDSVRDFRLLVRGLTGTPYPQTLEILLEHGWAHAADRCDESGLPLQNFTTYSFLLILPTDLPIQGNGGSKPPVLDKPATPGNMNDYKCLSAEAPEVPLDLCTKEDLGLHLSRAIECGDQESASKFAVALAKQKVPLQIQLKQSCYPKTEICMKVGVEDASDSVNISTYVQPHTTISLLKQQIFREHQFHPSIQRWIIGQCLCSDDRTVASYGIKRDGDTAFLYLLTAKQAKLGAQDPYLSVNPPQTPDSAVYKQRSNTLPPRPAPKPNTGQRTERTGRVNLVDVANKLYLELESLNLSAAPPPPPAQAGWSCSVCTFINKPTRPGCEMCSSNRPSTYVVPEEYKPDEKERRRLKMEQDSLQQYKKALEEERSLNFQHLLQLDNEVLIPNQEPIDCRICFSEVPVGGGVLLRECLHSFCRECLRQLVNCCEEPEVSCPFRDETFGCNSKLQQREIRALVSQEEYSRFLERGLVVAESRSQNSYHCRTADCRGWCIYEDSVNEFTCPICYAHNCLICKAIHDGMNCREYQDDLRTRAQNDAAARQTNDMLKTLVQTGEAMYCPVCQIIVQKKDGCDWIRCTMCHTEICWVTKGPRWGPQGPGDTLGGCQCNVNGKKCDPRCQNCH